MADHIRKRIRAAFGAALTGLATTGDHVYLSRAQPLQDGNLPALRISNPDEQLTELTMTPNPTLERLLQVEIDACAKAAILYEDTVDDVVREVEVALAIDTTLGGLCHSVHLRSISTEISGEGEKPVAVATMTYEVRYYTEQNAPDVAL